jgi:hypothetical protein
MKHEMLEGSLSMKQRLTQTARQSFRTWLVIFVMMSLGGSPALAKRRELKPGFNLFSKQQDVQLGKEAAAEIEKQVHVVKNADLERFINGIGKKLTARPEADAESFAYSFKVVQEKSINAFALPGGPAYVHTGLITAAGNEAQLAGVLAHEIAHVALRHGTNQVSKANLIQLPALLAGSLAGGSMMGQLAQLGVGLGANSVLLKFSRNAERDADLLGARLMAASGYNPIEMARFFEKLEAEGGPRSAFEQFLSDHPNPGNRVKAVEEEIRYLPKQTYSSDSGELQQMKRIIGNLAPLPAAPKPATTSGVPDIPLSGQFKSYRSQSYSLSYPDSWEVFEDRRTTEVTIAPRAGIVQGQGGGVAIGFGTIVNVQRPEGRRVDLERDTEQLIRQLQQSNPGLKVQDRSRKDKVGGERALITTLLSQSPYGGETELDTLVTVARPEGLFYVVFVSPQSRSKQVEATYREMLRSIRFGR